MSDHVELVREEFSRQAQSFEERRDFFANPRLMTWIFDRVPVEPDVLVLDVAAGTGHLARAIAPRARQVVALDLTPALLETGKHEADAAGLENVLFECGDAESLPYLDESFDLVVTRYSLHHFQDPERPIYEMARVCRPGGTVAVVDLVVLDRETANRHNELERLRDPTHTRALLPAELTGLLERTGLRIVESVERDQTLDFLEWLDQCKPPSEEVEKIRVALLEEMAGGAATGMRPFERDGRLHFAQRLLLAVARKPPAQ